MSGRFPPAGSVFTEVPDNQPGQQESTAEVIKPGLQPQSVVKQEESDVNNKVDPISDYIDTGCTYSENLNQLFYVRKSSYSHVNVIIDERDIERVKMTTFSKMLFIIKRLSNCFTRHEEKLISYHMKVPLKYFLEDGRNNRYMSLSNLRGLVKEWRKRRHPEISTENFDELLNEINLGFERLDSNDPEVVRERGGSEEISLEDSPSPNQEDGQLCWTSVPTELPELQIYIPRGDGGLEPATMIVDSGASLNCMPEKIYLSLGYRTDQLDVSRQPCLGTAGGRVSSLGSLNTFVFLKAGVRYYKLPLKFLILRCKKELSSILLGLPTLRESCYRLQFNDGVETLRLRVLTSGNRWVNRGFYTHGANREQKKVWFTQRTSAGENHHGMRKIKFTAYDAPLCNYVCDVYGDELVSKQLMVRSNELKWTVNYLTGQEGGEDTWPRNVTVQMELPVPDRIARAGKLAVNATEIRPDDFQYRDHNLLMTEALHTLEAENCEDNNDDNEFSPTDPMSRIEPEVHRRLGAISLEEDKQECHWLPDLSEVPAEWKDRFVSLFERYKSVFCKDKFSCPQSKLPLVPIRLKEGAQYRPDTPRPTRPEHCELIRKFVEKMLKAGYISEVTGDVNRLSQYSHNVFLVTKKTDLSESNEVIDKTRKMSYEERIQRLSKGARLVSDVKNLNAVLDPGNVPTTCFPTFSTEVKLYSDVLASQLDLTSCYFTIGYEEASKRYTQFSIPGPSGTSSSPRYFQYNRLIMGLASSPGYTNSLLSLVYNQDSFEDFMSTQEHPYVRTLRFNQCFSRYLDDLSIMAPRDGPENGWVAMFSMWWYILEQTHKWGLSLSATKISVGKKEITVLGFTIDLPSSTYRLSGQRKKALSNITYPRNITSLKCLLATCSYFSRSLLFTRQLLILHSLLNLMKDNTYHYTASHFREFECLIWSFELDLSVKIIKNDRYLHVSTDASLTAWSGVAWQMNGPPPSPENTGKGERSHVYELCGLVSRSFKPSEVGASTLSKELFALVSTLEYFAEEIHRNEKGVIVFVDFCALSLLPKLKFSNSRINKINSLLKTFPNLTLIHCKSASLNFLCDLLSRLATGYLKKNPAMVQAKYLDQCGGGVQEMTLITPAQVKYITNLALPDIYLAAPARQQPGVALSVEGLSDLAHHNLITEEEIYKAIFHGYSSLPAQSLVFKNQKTGKLISKGEFERLSHSCGYNELRKYLCFIKVHSHCEEDRLSYVNIVKDFLRKAVDVLREEIKTEHQRQVYQDIQRYVQQDEMGLREITYVYRELIKSGLLTPEMLDEGQLITFVPIYQLNTSEVEITEEAGEIKIGLRGRRVVRAGRSEIIRVNITMVGYFVPECHLTPLPSGLMTFGNFNVNKDDLVIHDLTIYNDSGEDQVINNDTHLMTITPHHGSPCSCQSVEPEIMFVLCAVTANQPEEEQFRLLLAKLIELDDVREEPAGFIYTLEELNEKDDLEEETPAGHGENSPREYNEIMNKIMKDTEKEHRDKFSKNNITQEQFKRRLMFLSIIYGRAHNGESVKPQFVALLQDNSELYKHLKTEVREGRSTEYLLNQEILYKIKKMPAGYRLQLCLDEDSYTAVIQSMHSSGRHYPNAQMETLVSQYFFCPNSKQVIEQTRATCALCTFTSPCQRRKYIQNPERLGVQSLGSTFSMDLMEDLPRSRRNNRFILNVVEESSGYLIATPLRDKTPGQIIKILSIIFNCLTIPSKIRMDFAGAFTSQVMRDFLTRHGIEAIKLTAGRSPENGITEVSIKMFRQLLQMVLHHNGGDLPNWDNYVLTTAQIYNSLIIHSKDNIYSRFFLLHGAIFHQNSQLISEHDFGNIEDSEYQQCLGLIQVLRARQAFTKKYQPHKAVGRWSVGQYVLIPRGKSDKVAAGKNSAVNISGDNIYQIMKLNHNGVIVKNLLTNVQTSKQFDQLRALPTKMLTYINSQNILSPRGSFWQSLPQRQRSPLMADLVAPSSKKEREPVKNPLDALNEEREESDLDGEVDNDIDVGEDTVAKQDGEEYDEESSPRYNLRPRKKILLTKQFNHKKISFSKHNILCYYEKKSRVYDEGVPTRSQPQYVDMKIDNYRTKLSLLYRSPDISPRELGLIV